MADSTQVPSLIIGVGGTGVLVATYVRKDLLEVTNGELLPPGVSILAFDTQETNSVKVGGFGRSRQAGVHRTGNVELSKGQYQYIGGENSRTIGGEVAEAQRKDQHHLDYLAGWWNAADYLDDHIKSEVWNLDQGAGQYRQFGRVALFLQITKVIDQLGKAIENIKQTLPSATSLYIHIVGSFVGGTGAGLFADIAHIARATAKGKGLKTSVRGYFALVDAFNGTPVVGSTDPNRRPSYQAKMYASLRECSRLTSATRWADGYPMFYTASGDDPIQRGKLHDPLFDAVYLFDGHRRHNDLVSERIEKGIAPTIADAIVAHVDEKSGNPFVQHQVNADAGKDALNISRDIATFGTLGTFTFVLPIFHIVEEWSHRLANEILNELLVPKEWNKEGLPKRLASDQRGGTKQKSSTDGAEEARRWLKQEAPTKFIRDVADIGQKYGNSSTQSTITNLLNSRSIETWIEYLKPEDAGAVSTRVVKQVNQMLQIDLRKKELKIEGVTEPNAYYVDSNPGGSDQEQSEQVIADVRKQLKALVGEEDAQTGLPAGGKVKDALDGLKGIHLSKFKTDLNRTISEELNGKAGQDAIVARGGKLGYMLAYLRQVLSDMRDAQEAIGQTEGGSDIRTGQKKSKGRKQSAEDALKIALEKMTKGGGFRGGNRAAYVEAAQQLLVVYKNQIAERVASETIGELIKVADSTLNELAEWAQILAFRPRGEGGVYGLVLDGAKYNADDRRASGESKVRLQMEDSAYENAKYSEYLSRGGTGDALEQFKRILGEFLWETRKDDGDGKIHIRLKLGDTEFNPEKDEHVGDANTKTLLERCRSVFDPAWDEMSVLRYLLDKYANQPNALAQLIYDRSGALLQTEPSQSPLPAYFLRVNQESIAQGALSDKEKEQKKKELAKFLDDVLAHLAILNSQAVESSAGSPQTGSQFLVSTDSMDRFKLSFVYFNELNQLKNVGAYKDSVKPYRQYTGRRNYLHVFPAEQHSLKYEALLGKMSPPQREREFEDKVVFQLENLDRLKFIIRCLVYGDPNYEWGSVGSGILMYQTVPLSTPAQPNPNNQGVWLLTAQPTGELRNGILVDPTSGEPATPKHWRLTRLSPSPSLLDAINQFNFVGNAEDNVNDKFLDEYTEALVRATLETAIDKDTERRLSLGFPWQPPSTLNPPRAREAQKRVAQYRRYQEALALWQKELTDRYLLYTDPAKLPAKPDPIQQREADLRTVIVLLLQEEIVSLKWQVDQYGGEWKPQPPIKLATVQARPAAVEPMPAQPQPVVQEAAPASVNQCPHCGETHPASWKACPNTGKPLGMIQCPYCGEMHPPQWKACPNTGKLL